MKFFHSLPSGLLDFACNAIIFCNSTDTHLLHFSFPLISLYVASTYSRRWPQPIILLPPPKQTLPLPPDYQLTNFHTPPTLTNHLRQAWVLVAVATTATAFNLSTMPKARSLHPYTPVNEIGSGFVLDSLPIRWSVSIIICGWNDM